MCAGILVRNIDLHLELTSEQELLQRTVREFAEAGWEPVLSTWTPMLGADPAKKRFT